MIRRIVPMIVFLETKHSYKLKIWKNSLLIQVIRYFLTFMYFCYYYSSVELWVIFLIMAVPTYLHSIKWVAVQWKWRNHVKADVSFQAITQNLLVSSFRLSYYVEFMYSNRMILKYVDFQYVFRAFYSFSNIIFRHYRIFLM